MRTRSQYRVATPGLEYNILFRDRRKYDSLMNGILLEWFDSSLQVEESVYENIVTDLLGVRKVPRHSYNKINSTQSLKSNSSGGKTFFAMKLMILTGPCTTSIIFVL